MNWKSKQSIFFLEQRQYLLVDVMFSSGFSWELHCLHRITSLEVSSRSPFLQTRWIRSELPQILREDNKIIRDATAIWCGNVGRALEAWRNILGNKDLETCTVNFFIHRDLMGVFIMMVKILCFSSNPFWGDLKTMKLSGQSDHERGLHTNR